jgi:Tfp pilus assembly protein PilV
VFIAIQEAVEVDMRHKKRKGFSIIEVLVASALSLSLGIVVATTLNTATNSMRKSTYRIKANSEARTLATNLNKFVSSAEARSYCVDTFDDPTNPTLVTKCSYIKIDDRYAPIIYFGSSSNNPTTDYQMEFFSNACLSIDISRSECADNSKRTNSARVKIYVKKETGSGANPTAEIGICYIKTPLPLYNNSNLPPSVSLGIDCSQSQMIYRTYGVKYSDKIFKLIGDNGETPTACPTTPLSSHDKDTCLRKIKSVRVVLDIPWINNPKNLAAMGSNKTSIDTFINIRSSNG